MQGKFPFAAIFVAGFMCVTAAEAVESGETKTIFTFLRSLSANSEPKEPVIELQDVPLPGFKPIIPTKRAGGRRYRTFAPLPSEDIPVPTFRSDLTEQPIQEPDDVFVENVIEGDNDNAVDVVEGLLPEPDSPVSVGNVSVQHDVVLRQSLGFAGGVVEVGGEEGVAYHLAAARGFLRQGEIGLARKELGRAKDMTVTIDEFNEVDALEVVATVLVGREDYRDISDRKNFKDWAVIEVVRSVMTGARTAYPGVDAVDEFLLWPDSLTSMIIHNLVLGVRKDEDLTARLAEKAVELHAAGKIDGTVLSLMKGYESLAVADRGGARASFAMAEGSNLTGVAARAKLEGLMMDISSGALSGEQVVSVARDIANARTADFVERAAWRVMADRQTGLEKVHSLRKLEQIEPNPQRKLDISNEINATLEMEVLRKYQDQEVESKTEVAEDVVSEQENVEVEEDSSWLLDDLDQDAVKPSQKLDLEIIDNAINKASEIINDVTKASKVVK